jgi:PAS domain S-box-containing protein
MNMLGMQLRGMRRYALAILIVAAAAGIRFALSGALGDRAVFVTFFPAVTIAALFGGFSGGLLATVLSAGIAGSWMEPKGLLRIQDPADWLSIAIFLVGCMLISITCEAMHRAQARATRAEGQARLAEERVRTESKLRRSEARYRSLFENMLNGFTYCRMLFDQDRPRDFIYLDVNGAFEKLTGLKNVVGKKVSEVIPGIRDTDPELFEVYGRVAMTGIPERLEHYAKALKMWFEISVYSPEKEHFVVIFDVITERKRAEEEKKKMAAQLFQAQKMESVGRLAGGVAHDFNNMLGVIIGYAELALKEVDPGAQLYRDLQEIQNAGQRSVDLTRQLLAFARKQTVSPKVLDLNNTMERTLKMLRSLIGEDINLTWNPGPALWNVRIDPSQIDQILTNLAVNVRDAISGAGQVAIETANVVLDDSYCAQHVGTVPGDYVLITLSDTGAGMSKEVLEHIFEPFFTTKEVGKGTGLGLATVYGIVKQNNGFIDVLSEPAKGTTFKLFLPRFLATAGQATAAEAAEKVRGGTETVLLVEDSLPLLDLGRKILKSLGYNVLLASTPQQAMELALMHAGDIRLLITDVVMPEMNGRQLFDRLCAVKSGIKCLYMSGYTADIIARKGVLEEGTNFIQKPFVTDQFAAKIRAVLEET